MNWWWSTQQRLQRQIIWFVQSFRKLMWFWLKIQSFTILLRTKIHYQVKRDSLASNRLCRTTIAFSLNLGYITLCVSSFCLPKHGLHSISALKYALTKQDGFHQKKNSSLSHTPFRTSKDIINDDELWSWILAEEEKGMGHSCFCVRPCTDVVCNVIFSDTR